MGGEGDGGKRQSESQMPLQSLGDPVFLDALDPVSLLELDSIGSEADATLSLLLGCSDLFLCPHHSRQPTLVHHLSGRGLGILQTQGMDEPHLSISQ